MMFSNTFVISVSANGTDIAVSPVAPWSGDMGGVSSSLVFFAGGTSVLSSTVSTFLFGGILVSYTVI